MKIILILLLVLAFLGGLYLAISIFANKKPPLSAANIHGYVAIAVLIALAYNAFSMNITQLWIAFAILFVAALGGLYLYSNHKKDAIGPKSAVIIHMIFALSGIALTLISIL
ncbi:hypothetical protein [Ulvibacterium marinum]|uniref:hypothetical protein n=1 Tax=Ulvibacterium marinum TaxID=2419782 RepID=UPI002495A5AD|nr:hypothetical protein [Ulvibacterium marinum]